VHIFCQHFLGKINGDFVDLSSALKSLFALFQTNIMNIYTRVRRWCLAIPIVLFSFSQAEAQLRISSGYDLSFTNATTANEILDNFNTANPNAISPFGTFGLSNGLLFGLRYEVEFLGVEASWIYRFDDEEAVVSEIDDVTNSVKLLGRFQTFSFGIDNQFDWFSYGGSVDFNITNIKAKLNEQDSKAQFLKENNYSGTFYLGFSTPRSNQIRLSFRPFVRIPLTNIDYKDLDINLNGETTVTDAQGRPMIFGLRVIFTNG